MTQMSQDFSVKSNARRAARKLGVDISKVVGFVKAGRPTVYRFPLPTKAAPEKKAAAKTKAAKLAKKQFKNSTKGGTGKLAPRTKEERAKRTGGGNFEMVAAMLREPGGAAIGAVCKATKWLPHTARARISVNVSKLLKAGERIERTRPEKGGESVYAIVPDKQERLPL